MTASGVAMSAFEVKRIHESSMGVVQPTRPYGTRRFAVDQPVGSKLRWQSVYTQSCYVDEEIPFKFKQSLSWQLCAVSWRCWIRMFGNQCSSLLSFPVLSVSCSPDCCLHRSIPESVTYRFLWLKMALIGNLHSIIWCICSSSMQKYLRRSEYRLIVAAHPTIRHSWKKHAPFCCYRAGHAPGYRSLQ